MLLRVFAFWIALFFSVSASAIDAERLNDILVQQKLDPDELGVIIEDEQGKVFALNEDKKLKPASLTKVVTAGAALEYLGPDFEFETELLADAPIERGRLRGSLYLRAAGDPEFDKSKLYPFVSALKQQKVTRIEGDIVVDDVLYSDIRARDGRSWSRSITGNSGNYPLFVNVDPPSKVTPHSRQWRRSEARLRRLLDLNDRFVIYQNMAQPDLWTAHHFVRLLSQAGIRVNGKVLRGSTPETARKLAVVSNPLKTVIREMLKSSNNFYADMMIRNLAAESGERPATVEAGMEFLYVFLDHVGVARDEYLLSCGAGFTHANFISTGAMAKILNHLRQEESISSVFFESLPVAGIDGTLKTRMRRTPAQGRVHAKTGYLSRILTKFRKRDGVVALGGFADALNGKIMTFVFVYNGTRPPSIVRATFDKILVELVKEPIRSISSVSTGEAVSTN